MKSCDLIFLKITWFQMSPSGRENRAISKFLPLFLLHLWLPWRVFSWFIHPWDVYLACSPAMESNWLVALFSYSAHPSLLPTPLHLSVPHSFSLRRALCFFFSHSIFVFSLYPFSDICSLTYSQTITTMPSAPESNLHLCIRSSGKHSWKHTCWLHPGRCAGYRCCPYWNSSP